MKIIRPIALLSLAACSVTVFAAPDTGITGVVPSAQDWEAQPGTFSLQADKLVIRVASKDAQALKTVAESLRDDLATQGFPSVTIVDGDSPAPGGVFLALTGAPIAHGPEAHTVTIANGVTIAGNSPAAVFFGTRSLLQMNKAHAGKIPCGVVQDWPDYPRRMMMLDVGRKPWPLPVLRDYIRTLAWHKMNELHLHLSDEAFGESYAAIRVHSDVFPGLSAKDLCYSKQEIRDLVAFAHTYGVTITPEFDMPGHAAAFTSYFKDCMLKGHPNYLDVSNPKTLEVMEKFVDEMIPLFDAPDFHIGTDEYRIGDWRTNPAVDKVHADFRKFINAMNAHIRSRGKNMRIWSGFENMGGKSVKIDPTVIIDMWDPFNDEHIGHPVINSSQFVTYYVPGAHYYGVNPGGLYDGFIPWQAGGNPHKPKMGDPLFLGAKLHVWCDHGPTGYTMTEIADLTLPGIQAISEKLWGTKGSAKYADFRQRAAAILPVPGVTVLDRLAAPGFDRTLLDIPGEVTLKDVKASVALPLADADRADLEYPWTLTMQVRKAQNAPGRNVLISSDLVEICANYARKEKVTTKFADGTERKADVDFSGIGVVRAAGARRGAGSPAETYLAHDVSKSFGKSPETDRWTTVTVVGTRGSTSVFVDGLKIGSTNNQMVCPLRRLGSAYGQSFVGTLRKIKVLNRALSDAEVGRAAGLDIPENLALGRKATASASDDGYGLIPANVTDGDAGSRWSSGRAGAQWLMIDLGAEKKIGGVVTTWENAFAKKYAVEVSDDGKTWKEVFAGEGRVGETRATFPAVGARFVRLNLKEAATSWGYSIFDLEVLSGK